MLQRLWKNQSGRTWIGAGLSVALIAGMLATAIGLTTGTALAWHYTYGCDENGNVTGTISFPAHSAPFTVYLTDHVPGDAQFKPIAGPGSESAYQEITPTPNQTSATFTLGTEGVRANANSIRIENTATNEKSNSFPPCGHPSPTATNTATRTSTPTKTATNTPQPTATNTSQPTATKTTQPTPTKTTQPTPTNTTQPTSTNTTQPTSTNTTQPTATNTSQPTATNTSQPTATNTSQPTATNTSVPTATNTSVVYIATPTKTHTATATATNTPPPHAQVSTPTRTSGALSESQAPSGLPNTGEGTFSGGTNTAIAVLLTVLAAAGLAGISVGLRRRN